MKKEEWMFQHKNLTDSLFRAAKKTLYLMNIDEQNSLFI